MNGRVYDPVIGRFLSGDPFVQDALSSQNRDRFTYGLNNPLASIDPSGYLSWSDVKDFVQDEIIDPIADAGQDVIDVVVDGVESVSEDVGDLIVDSFGGFVIDAAVAAIDGDIKGIAEAAVDYAASSAGAAVSEFGPVASYIVSTAVSELGDLIIDEIFSESATSTANMPVMNVASGSSPSNNSPAIGSSAIASPTGSIISPTQTSLSYNRV